jgi:thioredoxin-related protein
MLYRFLFYLHLALTALPALVAAESDYDWTKAAAEARERGQPIALLITGPDCGYCERLHREFLDNPKRGGDLQRGAITWEMSRDTGGKVTDFDGERIRTRLFLARYDIFATPTLLFLSPEGQLLAPALVGFNGAQPYEELVAIRLALARDNLASGVRPTRSILASGE